jgi:hypothetical protein
LSDDWARSACDPPKDFAMGVKPGPYRDARASMKSFERAKEPMRGCTKEQA